MRDERSRRRRVHATDQSKKNPPHELPVKAAPSIDREPQRPQTVRRLSGRFHHLFGAGEDATLGELWLKGSGGRSNCDGDALCAQSVCAPIARFSVRSRPPRLRETPNAPLHTPPPHPFWARMFAGAGKYCGDRAMTGARPGVGN